MPDGNIGLLEFGSDGTETLHHNLLSLIAFPFGQRPLVPSFCFHFPIIATGGYELLIPHIALRVADDDNGEHIHLIRVKILQRGDMDFLILPPCLTYKAHGSTVRTTVQKYFLQTMKLPIAPVAPRIIDGSNKISLNGSHDTLFNL